ncbi:MAG: DNA alkylation repair protein [Bacteroidia bacterium]|nr:DNA alkylation repair protein [Bacteroidia bacterium]
MTLSPQAEKIFAQISPATTKLGDLRKIAKEIKKDHDLALELWSSGHFMARQLAILIMDKKLISQEFIDELDKDLQAHDLKERNQLIDWFMANQLAKDKGLKALMESWENSPSAMQRRIFWYHQARLRWMGNTSHTNTGDLLRSIEAKMLKEQEEVQWAMNFTAGWIGVFDEANRKRCIEIGKQTGLYKDEVVPKNCTPSYLPEFIRVEAGKRDT